MPRFASLLTTALIACACQDAGDDPADTFKPTFVVAGSLADEALIEASGLARSEHDPNLLWVINDGGSKAHIHAIDSTGADRGRLKVAGAENVDWEDLAVFRDGDMPYLLVADIGDNDSNRDFVSLYVVPEPALGEDRKIEIEPLRRIDFRYPDGPRDAEAVAVDAENGRILVLTKRDLPPRLYAVPLEPGSDDVVTATGLTLVRSLPVPRRQDVEMASITKDWHWQPTAMDLSADGRRAAILTYRAVYLYQRQDDDAWPDVLGTRPLAFGLGHFREAESVAFDTTGDTLFVTVERKHAPVLRIDLTGGTAR